MQAKITKALAAVKKCCAKNKQGGRLNNKAVMEAKAKADIGKNLILCMLILHGALIENHDDDDLDILGVVKECKLSETVKYFAKE